MIERGKTMPIEIALRNYIGDVRTSTIERTRRDSGNCNLDNWMLYKYSRREEPTNDNSPILIADSLWSPRESQNNEDVISSSQLMTSLSGKTWQPSVTAYHANPFMVSRIEHFFILLFFSCFSVIDERDNSLSFSRSDPALATCRGIPTTRSYDRKSASSLCKMDRWIGNEEKRNPQN